MGQMTDEDYDLSMRISRRSRGQNRPPTRDLLVHRLRMGAKAVLRLPMSKSLTSLAYNIYCEKCARWMDLTQTGEYFVCPGCEGEFVMELAVFSKVDEV